MSNIENRFLDFLHKRWRIFLIVAFSILGLILRWRLIMYGTNDINCFVIPWMDQLKANGGLFALKENIGEYNVPYMTILALLTYLPIPYTISVKIVSILFDFLSAGAVYKIILEITENTDTATIGYCGILILPTIIMNSSLWGQCDSIYTALLLVGVLCFIKDKFKLCLMFVTLSLSFKLQAIFYVPALMLLYFTNRKFSIKILWVVPLSYMVSLLPALLCGRGILETVSIYMRQTSIYKILTLNYPNIYSLFSADYNVLSSFAILITACLLLLIFAIIFIKNTPISPLNIILLFAVCGFMCTYFLPGMHERYSFACLVFLFIYSVINTKILPLFALSELSIFVSYMPYIFSTKFTLETVFSFVNLFILASLTHLLLKSTQTQPLYSTN